MLCAHRVASLSGARMRVFRSSPSPMLVIFAQTHCYSCSSPVPYPHRTLWLCNCKRRVLRITCPPRDKGLALRGFWLFPSSDFKPFVTSRLNFTRHPHQILSFSSPPFLFVYHFARIMTWFPQFDRTKLSVKLLCTVSTAWSLIIDLREKKFYLLARNYWSI